MGGIVRRDFRLDIILGVFEFIVASALLRICAIILLDVGNGHQVFRGETLTVFMGIKFPV